MADFEKAFEITMYHEGGYSYDPDDAGGETYKGISRRYNPSWKGWEIIDDCKKFDFGVVECLKMKGSLIEDLVKEFYKDRYWDVFWGDSIDNQSIANELFDTSVNMGSSRAIKFLQKSLNFLNRNGTIYSDIVVDGVFGSNTFRAYRSLPMKDHSILYKMLNVLQGMHYMDYMSRSPIQEKYARGWFSRVRMEK